MRSGSSLALAFAAVLGLSVSARAETPAAMCARLGTDDTLRPIPTELVPAVNTLFGSNLPVQVAVATTVFRCADGHVMVCTTGANLPCGQANASREPAVGTLERCRDNPEADFVLAVATGHDTIYQWRCRHGVPEPVRQTSDVNARGFVARYWREFIPDRR